IPLEYAADVFQRLFSLSLDSTGRVGGTVRSELPRKIKHVTDSHGFRKWRRARSCSRKVFDLRRRGCRLTSTANRLRLFRLLSFSNANEKQTYAGDRDQLKD